jgi:hypothetical protein
MDVKGKTIKSRASGVTGKITDIDRKGLKITFTGLQDVTIPLAKAESLLIMDEETLAEINALLRDAGGESQEETKESKVQTYMDNYEEEEEENEEENEEEPPVRMDFDNEE